MVKRIVFVGEVGDEDVELAVVIVIAGGHAHASLLAAILVYRSARAKSDLFKRAVAFVPVMKVRRRIVCDKDIDQTIVIEIAGEDAEPVVSVVVCRRPPVLKRQ